MWPWGHLAVGYLLYTTLLRIGDGRAPSGPAALAVAFGTQFPDLIDKPLAWWLGVLPGGRTLGHSLLTLTIVLAVVSALARRREATGLAAAFGLGYLTHPFADAFLAVLQGDLQYVAYLFWPVFGMPSYETEAIVLASAGGVDFTVYGLFQLGLAFFTLLVWIADGTPGLRTLGRLFGVGGDRSSSPGPGR